jgi:hypothetical protein
MYKSLIDGLLMLNLVKNGLIAFGVLAGFWSIVGFVWGGSGMYEASERGRKSETHYKVLFASAVFCTAFWITAVGLGTSHIMQPEWQIARAIAVEVDKYNESNPEAMFQPTEMLKNVDSAVQSVFQVIQDSPNVIRQLSSGKTMAEIQSERERAEFEAWKAARDKQ